MIYYSRNHEYVRIENKNVYIGLSSYAMDLLGDITLIELIKETNVEEQEELGNIIGRDDSHELICPLACNILEINSEIIDDYELLIERPEEEGWIFSVKLIDKHEISNLLSFQQYKDFCNEEF